MTLWDVLNQWWRERTAPAVPVPDTLGQRGEAVAEQHLRALGYTILARGSRNKLGELDLIALDGQRVIFVEVKTRRSTDRGHPADAVDSKKQTRLTRLALAYLKRHRLLEHPCRFDVIAITWPDDNQPPRLEHYRHAFEATGRDSMYS